MSGTSVADAYGCAVKTCICLGFPCGFLPRVGDTIAARGVTAGLLVKNSLQMTKLFSN